MTMSIGMLSMLLILAAPISSTGLVTPATRRPAFRPGRGGGALHATRREFIDRSAVALALSSVPPVALPLPALAKEDPAPLTREEVASAFAAVRSDLESPSGVVATLSRLIEAGGNGSAEEILQFTKESDAFLRKGKMGKARKMLTDDALKGEALQMSNAVTFDLIGINRASRRGRLDVAEQRRYLGELRDDLERFLELERTIVVE